MKDPNTTNIHTHGLHLSGEQPADDVMFTKILPGETYTCEFCVFFVHLRFEFSDTKTHDLITVLSQFAVCAAREFRETQCPSTD